jgi:putative heme iron utilization protein
MKGDRANGDAAKPDSSTWAARQIVRGADRGALGTLQRDRGGHPHVSLVALASTPDGAPLLLISTLSEHTRNLGVDDRASLLIGAPAVSEDPLADARVTLMGRVVASDQPTLRARHLRRHPASALYAGFADFALHRFEITRANFVAGFGSARWLDSSGDLAVLPLFANDDDERAALDRLNGADHALLTRIAAPYLAADQATVTATGIDREGVDLRAGPRTARVPFEDAVADPADLGGALQALTRT